MTSGMTDEQRMVRDMVRAVAEEQVRPGAAERDRSEVFPVELFAQMGELGLLGMCVPVEYGGAGMDTLSYLLAVEELARADASVAVARALLYEAARESEQPGQHSRSAARAKLYASEMCNRVVAWAVQIHGGYGFSREYSIERL